MIVACTDLVQRCVKYIISLETPDLNEKVTGVVEGRVLIDPNLQLGRACRDEYKSPMISQNNINFESVT